MEATIKIDDKNIFQALVKFLKSFNIDVNEKIKKKDFTTTAIKSKSGLDDVFGMWKDSNITLDKIRQEQWGKMTV